MNKNNRFTQSVIIGSATLMAAVSWAGLESILFDNGNWIWPSIGFLILLIFLSLNWLLAKSKAILLTTFVFILVSFFFAFSFRLEYLPVLCVAFLFFILGSYRAVNEKEIRIKIQFGKIIRRGLPSILTGLSLIIATAYYFSPLALHGQNQIQIPRPLFNIIVQPIMTTIEKQVPLSQISEQLGIPLEENIEISSEQLQGHLYQSINQEINKYSQPYKQYFPFGLAIGFFLVLKTISVFFMWLIVLLSWLIFKILVSLGAIKIQEQAVLKQVIEV